MQNKVTNWFFPKKFVFFKIKFPKKGKIQKVKKAWSYEIAKIYNKKSPKWKWSILGFTKNIYRPNYVKTGFSRWGGYPCLILVGMCRWKIHVCGTSLYGHLYWVPQGHMVNNNHDCTQEWHTHKNLTGRIVRKKIMQDPNSLAPLKSNGASLSQRMCTPGAHILGACLFSASKGITSGPSHD
jgi:hypothetical protein